MSKMGYEAYFERYVEREFASVLVEGHQELNGEEALTFILMREDTGDISVLYSDRYEPTLPVICRHPNETPEDGRKAPT